MTHPLKRDAWAGRQAHPKPSSTTPRPSTRGTDGNVGPHAACEEPFPTWQSPHVPRASLRGLELGPESSGWPTSAPTREETMIASIGHMEREADSAQGAWKAGFPLFTNA